MWRISWKSPSLWAQSLAPYVARLKQRLFLHIETTLICEPNIEKHESRNRSKMSNQPDMLTAHQKQFRPGPEDLDLEMQSIWTKTKCAECRHSSLASANIVMLSRFFHFCNYKVGKAPPNIRTIEADLWTPSVNWWDMILSNRFVWDQPWFKKHCLLMISA